MKFPTGLTAALLVLAPCGALLAAGTPALKTRNVVLVTIDGLRCRRCFVAWIPR